MSRLREELDDQKDPEITLGTSALLAIFFGIVLVCAVFFGLGYSLGRHSGGPAVAAVKPSIVSNSVGADSLAHSSASPAADKSSAAPSIGSPARSSIRSQPQRVPQAAPASKVASATPALTAPATFSGAQTWVQLMAATQSEDANVLASALRKRGYHAVVRTDSDRLYHVQVGPFASRADADKMRRKLQANGYNAILK